MLKSIKSDQSNITSSQVRLLLTSVLATLNFTMHNPSQGKHLGNCNPKSHTNHRVDPTTTSTAFPSGSRLRIGPLIWSEMTMQALRLHLPNLLAPDKDVLLPRSRAQPSSNKYHGYNKHNQTVHRMLPHMMPNTRAYRSHLLQQRCLGRKFCHQTSTVSNHRLDDACKFPMVTLPHSDRTIVSNTCKIHHSQIQCPPNDLSTARTDNER